MENSLPIKNQACRLCKYLDVPLDSKGRRLADNNRLYECTYKYIQDPNIPESIATIEIQRVAMKPDEGKTCPVFEVKGAG